MSTDLGRLGPSTEKSSSLLARPRLIRRAAGCLLTACGTLFPSLSGAQTPDLDAVREAEFRRAAATPQATSRSYPRVESPDEMHAARPASRQEAKALRELLTMQETAPATDRRNAVSPLGHADPDAVGGDDKLILTHPSLEGSFTYIGYSMDIAENGDIYVAAGVADAVEGGEIHVYRSQDGGDTWTLWGSKTDADPARNFHFPSLHVAEGTENRLYLAYRFDPGAADQTINISYSDLALPAAVFTVRTVLSVAGVDFASPDISSDEVNFGGYRVYLVAHGDDGDGDDIWFTRSVDFGDTWEVEYELGSLSVGDRNYRYPHVRYGVSGGVHCVWEFAIEGNTDSAIRYRRALNFAAAGIADWEALTAITTVTDRRTDSRPSVAAAHSGDKVLIGYGGGDLDLPGGAYSRIRLSEDAGATWPAISAVDLELGGWGPVLLALPGAQGFRVGGYNILPFLGIQEATNADPLTWTTYRGFTDVQYFGDVAHARVVALDYDLSRGNRLGMVWPQFFFADDDFVYFDAEWRDDPGYPNLEPGFPLALPAAAISPPAVVNLDDDGDLEIVFGDADGNIQVRNPDGTNLPGWPIDIGEFPNDGEGAVAIGDLDGDYINEVVAGSRTGIVYAYRNDGSPLPGWPVDLGTGIATYVSIGAVTTGSNRQVVAASNTELHLLLANGTESAGYPRIKSGTIPAPAAIGDIEGDGDTDIVVVFGSSVTANEPDGSQVMGRTIVGKTLTQAPTLADLDLDNDLEIAVPTAQGDVYVLQNDGTDYGTWPFSDPSGDPMLSVALGNVLGTAEPELAFAVTSGTVHLFTQAESEAAGWPHAAAVAPSLIGMPTIETLDEGSPDVVLGSTDESGYAWNNLFTDVPGWPKALGAGCLVSAASSDIDTDGRVEVVFVTASQLVVLDLGADVDRLDRRGQWPMYAYNPQRTGCLACGPDAVIGVPTRGVMATIRFAAPAPNPSAGSVTFAFELPDAGPVTLSLYDAQGRLIRNLLKTERPPGSYREIWDARNDRGVTAMPGIYYARLTFAGPTGSSSAVRRVTMVR
jgi:hypothetical protein